MPQIFHRSANAFSRFTIFGGIFLIAVIGWAATEVNRSAYFSRQKVAREQPVPFSHRHHVGQLGLDCRYCHVFVEESATAGVPPTQTCMNCHSQIWTNAELLEPVRESFRTGKSLEWTKVHDLPDFVYFNHSIHIAKGVACETCHGPVNDMPLMYQQNTLHMQWCLDCHRNPEKFIRPKSTTYSFGYEPEGGNQKAVGAALVKEYNIHTRTECSACHR